MAEMNDPTQHQREQYTQSPYQPAHQAQAPYPPLPPPPAPQLPDFQPKGMSTLDKVLAWTAGFAVLVFVLLVASHYLLRPLAPELPKHIQLVCSAAKGLPRGTLLCKQ